MMGKRHGSIAKEMAGLAAYLNRPEETPDVKTNWSTTPANDNNPEDIAGMKIERRLRCRPSVEEIMQAVDAGTVERNEAGKIVRIGKLEFSDGTRTEKAYCNGPDGKLIQYDARMPVGAMMNTGDAQERMLGGNTRATDLSNHYFQESLGGVMPYAASTKERQERDDTPIDMAAITANTDMSKVRYTKAPKGFPWQPARLADLFIGMKKGRCAESGSQSWEDIASSKVSKEIWDATLAAMDKGHKATLDVAAKARNMSEVGETGGYKGKNAQRRGKRMLMAANDNLLASFAKSAA